MMKLSFLKINQDNLRRYLMKEKAKLDHLIFWPSILWGLIMALLSISLLLIGGLNVVQTSAVVVAVPVVIIYILLIISLMKWLKNDDHIYEEDK